MIGAARRVFHPVGLDLVRYRPSVSFPARRFDILSTRKINLVLDIGAHVGYYGRQLRLYGYRGRIVSLEPLSGAFALLRAESADDATWDCRQLALGKCDVRRELHVAGNEMLSSSFL